MATHSMTYVYNKDNQVICRVHLQNNGEPSGIGADLARFLTENRKTSFPDMERLSAKLVCHFFQGQDNAMLIAPEDPYYYCEEYEYHIYQDKVRIVDCGTKEYDFNWHTDSFEQFCWNYKKETNEDEDEESDYSLSASRRRRDDE